ncbi:E1b [Human adenovirus 1]|nr:E1b [Human adenovirus 1]
MERRNPSERGVPAGFSGHAFVESGGETQESPATVVFRPPGNNTDGGAAAATAAAGGSQAAAAAGAEPMEPESRPGPSGMNVVQPESMSKVNLNGVFDMTMKIWKVLRYDETRTRCRPCECGGKHIRNQPVMLDVTEELRPDHLVLACTRAEFGSSDEDTD